MENVSAEPGHGHKGLVAEVVLTGGPGSGKTASLLFLSASLSSRGYRILICPELATMIYTGGVPDIGRIAQEERPLYVATQGIMFVEMQRAMREYYRRYADCFSGPVVIIYDRAELDAAAYLSEEEFASVLERMGMSRAELRDSYDVVIHLDSVAGSLEDVLSGNVGRRESSTQEALAADVRTWEAWEGHPRHHRIESHVSFDVKLARVLTVIAETIAEKTA
jgi:predicted ATPase